MIKAANISDQSEILLFPIPPFFGVVVVVRDRNKLTVYSTRNSLSTTKSYPTAGKPTKRPRRSCRSIDHTELLPGIGKYGFLTTVIDAREMIRGKEDKTQKHDK